MDASTRCPWFLAVWAGHDEQQNACLLDRDLDRESWCGKNDPLKAFSGQLVCDSGIAEAIFAGRKGRCRVWPRTLLQRVRGGGGSKSLGKASKSWTARGNG